MSSNTSRNRNASPTGSGPPTPGGRRASRWGHRWRRLGAVVGLLSVLGAVAVGLEVRRFRRELERARQELGRREWGAARRRLEALARWHPGWGGGEADYLLGLFEWDAGRRDAALESFGRIPPGSEFEARAAVLQSEALVMRWQFRAAEDRLVRVLRPGRRGLNPVRERLVRLARMEARFDEARAWLRESFAEAGDPVAVLRQLWLLDRGVAPTGALRENLERARTRSPDDDRVWLGLGRVDTLDGRLDEAARWLRRCADRTPEDRTVDRAWLDWAAAAGRADEVARVLAGPLWADLAPPERLAWQARLAQLRGSAEDERRALERWLDVAPRSPAALERLGALAAEAGDAGRAAEVRGRKARVDEALADYRRQISGPATFATPADRLAMARLAEEAGRPFDARAWCTLAARSDPAAPGLAEVVARLDREDALVRAAAAGTLAASERPRRPLPPPAGTREGQAPERTRLAFRDDAEAAGLRFTYQNGETPIRQIPETMGGGVGLLDYDGDGWLDVYAVQGGPFPPDPALPPRGDRLFRNRGDGTFEDVTGPAGIAELGQGYGHGVAVGDYDGDGRPDLFVTRWRAYGLYRNRGDGTFADATRDAGLDGDRDWPTSAAFADLDGDGDLDLYVCHYLAWDTRVPKTCRDRETHGYVSCSPLGFPALPDHVFRNDGGRFVDVTASAGIAGEEGRGLGVVAADLDGDGRVDLFVTNDQSANAFFRNRGGFSFEEVAHEAGLASSADGGYKAGMGIACGDLDGDGRPDLAVTNFYGEATTLYQNLGGGLFGDRTAASGLALASRHLLGFGAAFLDADNDGQLDLLTANGHLDRLPGTPYTMPVQLLLGRGGRLRDATAEAGPALLAPRIGRALAVGDLDNDGRVDAVVLSHNTPLAYLHNQTTGGGHFLVLRLEGTRSNRDAIGARADLIAGGAHHVAWRIGGGSYQSASDARLHFGLGPAGRVEAVEVAWPSGKVQRFEGLRADRGYRLVEGEDRPRPLAGFPER